MKFNWKILVAGVLIVGVLFWAFDTLRARSYSGENLTFAVGSGVITLTNPAVDGIPVQLIGTGSRSFSIVSTIEGLTGSSTRQGTGSSATQLFEFVLPTGISEITVMRGSGVNFVTETDTRLEAVVQPVSASQSSSTTVLALVVVLGLLFYMSYTTEHRWIGMLRNRPATTVLPIDDSGGQGKAAQSYGDNRA